LQPPATILVAQPYSQDLTAGDILPPNQPCSWSITAGALPPGLNIAGVVGNNVLGRISGTPTQAGQFIFTVTASCSAGADQGSQAYVLFVSGGPLSIAQKSIPEGAKGSAYNSLLTAAGGVPPYIWSFGPGTNSNGLGLCPQNGILGCAQGGLLFGTPTATGSFTLNPVVRDAVGTQANVSLSFVVVGILTTSLAPGAVGTVYSQTLAGSGGTPPYVWSVSTGSLPAGLSLDPATGIISGTPTAAGVFPITIALTDASLTQATAALNINILGITTTSLPDGVIGTAYAQTLQAVGGTPPLTWAVVSGTLPAGLTLNPSTGTISGTPTAAGSSSFTVSASYPLPNAAAAVFVTAQMPLTIVVAGSLSITTTSLTVIPNVAFTQTLAASGGTSPLTWAIVTGTLPAGLQLNAATGVISGTTSATTGTPITVTVTDSRQQVARGTIAINFVTAPTVNITGLPQTSGPGQQPTATVSISAPYPLNITGTLTLTFASSVGGDDQMIRFSSGTCTVAVNSHTCTAPFTIPAGSTQGAFGAASNVSVLTGTVAGTITVTAKLTDPTGNDITPSPVPTSTIVTTATVPVITSVKITNPAPGQLSVTVVGFSSTRDMVSGLFHFAPSTTTTLTASDITIQLGTAFTSWYSNTASNAFGSQFTLTIPFTYQANSIPIVAVTVTLTNSKGASNPSAPANP
jgi:hypothetical protein